MSEVLLQTIVEKLESLEIALLKESNAGKDETTQKQILQDIKSFQSQFLKFTSQFKANNEELYSLSKEINALRLNSSNTAKNLVKHIHHFHKQVWITVSLFTISLLLAYGWINCNNTKKSFEANDIKYRYLKANGNASLLKITYYTDSLYNGDKENFIKQLVRAEQQTYEQEKVHRLAGEKEKRRNKE